MSSSIGYENLQKTFETLEEAVRQVQELAKRRQLKEVVAELSEAVASIRFVEEGTLGVLEGHVETLRPLFDAFVKCIGEMFEAAKNGRIEGVVWGVPDALQALKELSDVTLSIARRELP